LWGKKTFFPAIRGKKTLEAFLKEKKKKKKKRSVFYLDKGK